MTNIANKKLTLAKRPVGDPQPDNWALETETIDGLAEGEVLVQTALLSIDPAMRGWMNESKSYIRPVKIGEVMRALAGGKVIESRNPRFTAGDYVTGAWGVQEYAKGTGDEWQKVDTKMAPLETYVGTLGLTGMTAYFGLLDVGKPQAGETVLISGAAGATGSMVGQIAKVKGCRVVGIAGGAEKCRYVVEELGFDACVDYKEGRLHAEIKKHCPEGIDIFFDNVGGEILNIALAHLRLKARVIICGAISQYNNTTAPEGPANYLSLLVNRARMEGFVVLDYASRYAEAGAEMAQWMMQGKIKGKNHIVSGTVEDFPETLMMLFRGENFGKLMLKLD
ncbi:NADP-dependent oxidoreductase [Eisenibacter elegans]|jgi:NADPH-dependent curcumin reductase CurA|uniref:NADP-dependent oxidoreductase n=1 Tax=Eisenibacter elegans TaxID=997 RepID=UPI000404F2CC|nr:NADP-dependent oxidoreductase [Eisenibacter elegans]